MRTQMHSIYVSIKWLGEEDIGDDKYKSHKCMRVLYMYNLIMYVNYVHN